MPTRRTLVIPMHQESGRIEATLDELRRGWAALGECELVLVDDGSTDGSAVVAERAARDRGMAATVVRRARNGGKGAAIASGVATARGEVVAFVDADLSPGVDAVARFFEIVESGDADVAVASRALPGSEVAVPAPIARQLSSVVFRSVVHWAGVSGVADTQCGLKAFRTADARRLFDGLSVQRFAFDVEVLLRAELAGLRVVEVPVQWRHVRSSTVRPVRDGARMVVDVVRLRGRSRGWSASGDSPVAAVLEREHWWYAGGRTAVIDAARRAGVTGPAVDLDAQTGALLEAVEREGWEPCLGAVAGRAAAAFAALRKLPVVVADVASLPQAAGSAGVVFAVDVLEHLDDDAAVVREAARVLRPGGALVLTVPADPARWSSYDVALGHRRRYTATGLRALLAGAGLEVVEVVRLHAWLAPLSFLLSRTPLRSVLLRDPERATFVHRRTNRLLRALVAAERRARRRGVSLPFGPELVAVARRGAVSA